MSKKSLFNKLYGAGEGIKRLARKPGVKRKINRKHESALDDCENKRLDLEERYERKIEEFDDMDFSELATIKQEIDQCAKVKEILLEIKKDLFDDREWPAEEPE